jgi:hypothetical protein
MIEQLKTEIEKLKQHHEQLTAIIEEANKIRLRDYNYDG